MLAGCISAPRTIELIDVPEPVLRQTDRAGGASQIIFQPRLGCLCGSDMLFFEANDTEWPPVVGHSLHEMIGTVVESTGSRFKVGDQVLCIPDRQLGLFERFVAEEDQAVAIDARLSQEQAVLSQPLGTVICGLKKIPNPVDMDVAVVGQGPIGQLFCAAFRNLGARQIIAIDRLASRLTVSPQMGATAIINASRQDPVEATKELTDGVMADLVVEAVGHHDQALNLCIDLCCHRGRILSFGVLPEQGNIHLRNLLLKNLTVHMTIGPDFRRDFPLAMRWIAEGRMDLSPIITHRFALAQIQEAFDTFHDRRDGALKVFVEFPENSS